MWLDEPLRIPFKEGVWILIDCGWTDESGNSPSPLEHLHTRDKILLGELTKEKYQTHYFILNKPPASASPSNTTHYVPDPDGPNIASPDTGLEKIVMLML